jgi:hypothetical protein
MQDWITVRGSALTTIVKQPEDQYPDLSMYQDLVVIQEVSDLTGGTSATTQMTYETAPTKDDVLFDKIDATAQFIMALGVTRVVLRYSAVSLPISRYVRWKLTGGTGTPPWSVTFRVWLSPNL